MFMFRPYNLRSLAAWTFGSLAGNEAYYRVKAGSRRATRSSTKLSYSSHLYVSPKLETLFTEVNSLTDQIRNMPNRADGKFEIMPLVPLMAYREWFRGKKDSIVAEVQSTENIQTVADHLDYVINEMSGILSKHLLKNEYQRLLEMIKDRMTSCEVNESSYKLTDSNSGRFFIEGKNSKA